MKKLLALLLAFSPSLAFAQAGSLQTQGLEDTVQNVTKLANRLIPLFITIALLFFIVGVIRVVMAKDPEARKGAVNFLIYSVVGFAVILSVFGIARLLIDIFGLKPAQLESQDVPFISSETIEPN